MKNKKAGLTTSTIILVIVFIIGLYFGYKTFNQRDKIADLEEENKFLQQNLIYVANELNKTKVKICPDKLIINKTLPIDNSSVNYFIVNRERKEISDFDLKFVIENCNLSKETRSGNWTVTLTDLMETFQASPVTFQYNSS